MTMILVVLVSLLMSGEPVSAQTSGPTTIQYQADSSGWGLPIHLVLRTGVPVEVPLSSCMVWVNLISDQGVNLPAKNFPVRNDAGYENGGLVIDQTFLMPVIEADAVKATSLVTNVVCYNADGVKTPAMPNKTFPIKVIPRQKTVEEQNWMEPPAILQLVP